MTLREQIANTLLGMSALTLSIMAYYRVFEPDLALPLDLATLSWLVYELDPPRLALGYRASRLGRLPFITFSLSVYTGASHGDIVPVPFLAVVALVSLLWAVLHLNRTLDFERMYARLRRRLEDVKLAYAKSDPDHLRKRVILFWGVLKFSSVRVMTLDIVVFPVLAIFLGLLSLVLLLTMSEIFEPVFFTATILIVSLHLIRLSRTGLSSIAHRGPMRSLAEAWSLRDRAEQILSKRILISMLRPHGFFYFWGLVATGLVALTMVFVLGAAVAATLSAPYSQDLMLYQLCLLTLLSLGYLPAFGFPAYLIFSLISFRHGQSQSSPQLPRYASVWMVYSLAMWTLLFGNIPLQRLAGLDATQFQCVLVLVPAGIGTTMISLAILQASRRMVRRDEQSFWIGALGFLAFFVLLAGSNRHTVALAIVFTSLMWYGFVQILSRPLARPFTRQQRLGGVSLSASFLLGAAESVLYGELSLALLATLGSGVVLMLFMPREINERIAKSVFGMREEIAASRE